MDSDTPVFKWTAAAIGVILVCFCLGYFVLGPNARTGQITEVTNTSPDSNSAPAAAPLVKPVGGDGLVVEERTDEIEAKRKKAAETAKKKADDEAKKKADADAKRKAEEAAAAAAAATPDPNPNTTPTPDAAQPTPAPDATPTLEPTPAPPVAESVHRVRLGSFDTRDAAKVQVSELNGRGYQATVVTEKSDGKTTYRVQLGAYKDRKAAETLQKELKANGYDAEVD